MKWSVSNLNVQLNWIDINNNEIVFNVIYDFLDKKNKKNKNVEIFDHVLITIKVQNLTFKKIVFDENVFVVKINVKCWNRHRSESRMMIIYENNNISLFIILFLLKLVVFVVVFFLIFIAVAFAFVFVIVLNFIYSDLFINCFQMWMFFATLIKNMKIFIIKVAIKD